ncbi:MAG: hypothetical protein HKN67_04135 [Saprospiraceae bacterium]|nr:hypothetical protein [Saprospiraceae bacterium]
MKKRTRDAYLQQLNRQGISYKDSLKMATRIEVLDENRQLYKFLVKESFSKYYSFSKVYFVENHMYKQLTKGGVVEMETHDDEIITSDQLEDYYVLTNGYNDHNWIIKQSDLSAMPTGFPDEYNSGFKRVVNWAANKSNLNEKDMNKVAIKINERLFKYYHKIKEEY